MIRATLILFILAVASAVGYGAYNYLTNLQEQVVALSEQNVALEAANERLSDVLTRMRENMERQAQLNSTLQKSLQEAETSVDNLRQLLQRHDLTKLAYEKPGLIERRINDATKDVFDQLELDTGAGSVQ